MIEPRPPQAARLEHLTIAGPAGALEAVLQERREHDHEIIALVCHPHPLHGGTMDNKVVHRAAGALHRLGAAVLRFNFRGAGKSAGTHDRGQGELEDARASLDFLHDRYPGVRCWVAGFSFGSWIAARLAAHESGIERLILIAPPVRTQSFEALRNLATPKLVIQGTADEVCPLAALERELPLWAEPKTLITVPGASHFFDRRLAELEAALRQALEKCVP